MAENRSDEQGAPGDDWSPAAATTPSVSPSSPTPASPAPATETPQDLLTTDPAVSAEHDRLVAERAARRQQRLQALAPKPEPEPLAVATAAPVVGGTIRPPAPAPEPVTVVQRSNDKWAGSLGLFLLRWVTAAIMGVHGANKLLNLPAATEVLQSTVLPAPGTLAIVVGAAEIGIAIALVFGLLTRVAGLGVVLIAAGALAFVQWGPWSPFVPGSAGFNGELELLLVAVGVVLLLLGGGGWSVDRGFRGRRTAE
ncbi:MAG: DoxX family protein [Propioniciclava sp.]|jgi:putative oxidoreductase